MRLKKILQEGTPWTILRRTSSEEQPKGEIYMKNTRKYSILESRNRLASPLENLQKVDDEIEVSSISKQGNSSTLEKVKILNSKIDGIFQIRECQPV